MTSFFSFDHHDISFKTTFGGFLRIGDPQNHGFQVSIPRARRHFGRRADVDGQHIVADGRPVPGKKDLRRMRNP